MILLFLSAIALGSAKNHQPIIEPVEIQSIPNGDLFTYVCANCNTSEKAMVPKMQAMLNELVKSKCFETAWLSFNRIEQSELNGKVLTKLGVIEAFRTNPIKNIPLFFYTPTLLQSKKVIGYTVSGEPTIYLNRS